MDPTAEGTQPQAARLTLEEQLANIKKNTRGGLLYRDEELREVIGQIVEMLRANPTRLDVPTNLPTHFHLRGLTSLHWAVRMEDTSMVAEILVGDIVDFNGRDDLGKATAFHYACKFGNLDIANLMVSKHLESGLKLDVNAVDEEQRTALHYACKYGKTGIVKVLIANHLESGLKLDVNAVDKEQGTALHYACKYGKTGIVKVLIANHLESGLKLDVNAVDKEQGTALHYACMYGNTDIVEFLVSKHLESGLKLDVNAVDAKQRTALHYACQFRNTDIVKVLIANHLESGLKLDVNAVDAKERTAVHYACHFGDMDMVKFFVSKHLESGLKLDVNAVDEHGHTVLHHACNCGNVEIVKVLIANHLESGLKLDVNAVDGQGFTALHFAVQVVKKIDNVRELLKCKDIRLSDESRHGETPLQIAHERGAKDAEKALMEHETVRRYVEDLYRDRQVYVDAANAILVGAALIASVTFGSWLQPPLGLTPDYADVQHNIALGVFWIFNSFSFYFAIATVVFGARSVLPRNVYFIKRTVEKLRKNLLITAVLLACSVFFVIIAFGIAGCIVLTPILKYRWYMIVPTIIGGLVCLSSLGFLSWSMWEDSFGRSRVAHSTR